VCKVTSLKTNADNAANEHALEVSAEKEVILTRK
jgi:hypothetical protein